jgi:hypothetical protein
MEKRPPILRWKVSLALVAVVVVAVILGSALHSTRPQTATRPQTGITSSWGSTVTRGPIHHYVRRCNFGHHDLFPKLCYSVSRWRG